MPVAWKTQNYIGDGYCDDYEGGNYGMGRPRNVGRPKKVNMLAYNRKHKASIAKKANKQAKSKFVYLADLQNVARKHGVRGFTVMGKKALHMLLAKMGLVH